MLNKNFKEGEYVYIPSGVVGYIFDDVGGVEKYIKFKEPKLLMFLGQEIDSGFGGEYLCKLFFLLLFYHYFLQFIRKMYTAEENYRWLNMFSLWNFIIRVEAGP